MIGLKKLKSNDQGRLIFGMSIQITRLDLPHPSVKISQF